MMILRYFYIRDYYEKTENLNINLGGRFRFWYQNEKLYVEKNENYAHGLYEDIPEISDVSAILGKNGAGKTSVLRIINFLFNDLQNQADGRYIIIFELPDGRYIIYSKLYIKNISEAREIINIVRVGKEEIQRRFKDIGLVYYSGIFDKTTPFQENANLKDISINNEFEKFCKNNIYNDPEDSIVSKFRADNIKREVKFHIAYNKEFEKSGLQLLFNIPRKIEVGFFWDIRYIEKWIDNEEIRDQLRIFCRIVRRLEDYILEKNNAKSFLRELLFVLLLDEIVKNLDVSRYNFTNILIKIENRMIQNEWEIEDYFQNIIDELFLADLEDIIDYEDGEEEKAVALAHEDIWDEVDELIDDFQNLKKLNIKKAYKIIGLITEFVVSNNNYWGKTESDLLTIYDWISEVEDELEISDFDLYIVNQIYAIAEFLDKTVDKLEKKYGLYTPYMDREVFGDVEEIVLPEEVLSIPQTLDHDTQNRLDNLVDIKECIISLVKESEYDPEGNKIKISLDDEKVLEFIYKFEQLECKLVELDIDRKDISSGHAAYLDMCTRLNTARSDGIIVNKTYVILLIDEGDIYLHPEMQLRFVNGVLNLCHHIFAGKKVQIIFTSNSPFIISDIQSANITYLERNDIDSKEDDLSTKIISNGVGKTFAANVNDLLVNAFFVKNGLIGEFAVNRIDGLIKELGHSESDIIDKNKYKELISIIGEPLIRRKLEKMLFVKNDNRGLKEQLEYYKKQISLIESRIEYPEKI